MQKETKLIEGVSVDFVHPESPSNKPPILMVHGGCHGSWCWENYLTYFASKGYETAALNWFNHPGSKRLPEDEFTKRSIAAIATEIDIVVKHLGKMPILMAHSIGGLASINYHTKHEVAGLVLLAPALPSAIGGTFDLPLPPFDFTRPFEVPPFEQAYAMFFTGSSMEEAKKYYDKLCPESTQTIYETVNFTLDVDLTKIKAPTLIFGADQDILVSHQQLEKLATTIGAPYICLEDRSHNILLEPRWEETTLQIYNWLKENFQ